MVSGVFAPRQFGDVEDRPNRDIYDDFNSFQTSRGCRKWQKLLYLSWFQQCPDALGSLDAAGREGTKITPLYNYELQAMPGPEGGYKITPPFLWSHLKVAQTIEFIMVSQVSGHLGEVEKQWNHYIYSGFSKFQTIWECQQIDQTVIFIMVSAVSRHLGDVENHWNCYIYNGLSSFWMSL